MIKVGTAVVDALDSYEIIAISFLTLEFPASSGGTMRITEAPRDITIGNNTFTSESNLMSISVPQAQSSFSRDRYTISFSDNTFLMREKFAATPAGVPLKVQLGFINQTTGTLISELLDVYKGQSSAIEWSKDGEGFVLKASFTGQLAQLGEMNTRLTSVNSQKEVDTTDDSMIYIHNSTSDETLKWGRE
jgi:hypothetical protein